ncbi:UNVERIFIED_CONTAM: protein POLLENLESS 3-LIKE 2 [Sesamum radiatum]|uniref:Protein POLLENLESS 3-LIKE 2 n=1 Tax=Sesamum radiatum TaxID=300843 RepID=A0AAW2P2R3_SESRA
MWNGPPGFRPTKSAPSSPAKPLGVSRTRSDTFHVTHKVPVGDTPYVRAKNVQLVDKDPERAIPLFWAAINAGDRVDSALKDMAIVMKQQNRAEEAIEAIKSLRSRCSDQAQESLDNILLDLYKEWPLANQDGEEVPREEVSGLRRKRGDSITDVQSGHLPDETKERIARRKETRRVKPAVADGPQPQPCKEQNLAPFSNAHPPSKLQDDAYADENANSNIITSRLPQRSAKPGIGAALVRKRGKLRAEDDGLHRAGEQVRKQSISPEKTGDKWADLLPDSKDFEEAIIAAFYGRTEGTTKA